MRHSIGYKAVLALNILFVILTVIGAGYVILNHGEKSPGFAVAPMLGALLCSSQLKLLKAADKNKNDSGDGE